MHAESAPSGYYAPTPYDSKWLWIGAALLALVILWYLWVFWSTRVPRPKRVAPMSEDRLTRLRADYLRQIDGVLARARDGEITPRRGHQELSVLVRHFVQEVSGVRAPTMTLTDLNRSSHSRLTPVAEVVAKLYPGEFGPKEAETLEGAAAVAREVIQRWI